MIKEDEIRLYKQQAKKEIDTIYSMYENRDRMYIIQQLEELKEYIDYIIGELES